MSKSNSWTCPRCGEKFTEKSKAFPFCSDRCKLIDLGAWANEQYRIASKDEEDEDESQQQDT